MDYDYDQMGSSGNMGSFLSDLTGMDIDFTKGEWSETLMNQGVVGAQEKLASEIMNDPNVQARAEKGAIVGGFSSLGEWVYQNKMQAALIVAGLIIAYTIISRRVRII